MELVIIIQPEDEEKLLNVALSLNLDGKNVI